MGKDRGHGKVWLFTNADDGNCYWCYCRKYSDEMETEFKRQVYSRSGYECRKVQHLHSEPDRGYELDV